MVKVNRITPYLFLIPLLIVIMLACSPDRPPGTRPLPIGHIPIPDDILTKRAAMPTPTPNPASTSTTTPAIAPTPTAVSTPAPTLTPPQSATITLAPTTVPTNSPPPGEVIYDIDIREMLELAVSNEVAAEAKYKGKLIRTTGIVGDIKIGQFRLLPLDPGLFQISGLECNLITNQHSLILNLRKGDEVTIYGRHGGFETFLINNAKIDDCQLLRYIERPG